MSWRRHLRPSLEALTVYDVAPATAGTRLHANECPEPWPAEVVAAIGTAIADVELGRYPDTSGRALRAVLGDQHGCAPDRIVLGNGSDEVIFLLLTALSGAPDGKVVIPTPTFVMYAHTARVLGMQVAEVPLTETLQLDEPGLSRALDGAAACFLARPNNPTSSLFDAAVVRRLVKAHPDTVFVIDEAYAPYAPGQSLWSAGAPDNLVHMATLSKIGLAAVRVGYCIANSDLALALNKVRHPYNISATSLTIAHTVLTRFGDVQAAMIERVIGNRARLVNLLERIEGAMVYPAWGNLALARLPEPKSAPALVAFLAQRGILIKDVSRTPGLAGCVRVSVGTSEDLDRLESALAEFG